MDTTPPIRRLSLAWLRLLAGGLGLTTMATLADLRLLRLLIDGKVEELGHQPRNVLIWPTSECVCLSLQDMQGEFLHVEPPEKVDLDARSSGSEDLHRVVESKE